MLANNNKRIINKLAQNSVKSNKKQFIILFCTIALSAFMLFSVLTTGITYLDSARMQNTRLYGAEYDIAIMNGFDSKQYNTLQKNQSIKNIGIESYAGFVKSTEFDDTVEIGLLWCDENFWNKLMSPARTGMIGEYPQKANELMVTKEILKSFGKENISIGEKINLTYENNTGVHTGEFVISGIWDGYGHSAIAFVSESFYEKTGYDLEKDGILCIKLNSNYVLPSTIETMKTSLDISERQSFAPSGYIENSFKYLFGIMGLVLVICLSGYLLIYNILYLSVSGKIRYYGLLQSLGMTKKQLRLLIAKQMILIGSAGMITGILSGIFMCMKLVPYIMGKIGIASDDIVLNFNPLILTISVFVSFISIYFGVKKPMNIVTGITPIEATRYRTSASAGTGYKRKKRIFFWRLAFDQFTKDKKRTIVVLISLSISLSVFYCLTTIISSQGERTVLPNYWNSDYMISNHSQTTEEINSIKPVIDDYFLDEIGKIGGIKDFHTAEAVPAVFPYIQNGFTDMWIKNYIERTPYLSEDETISAYEADSSKYYGMLIGIDENEFDHINQLLNSPVDKQEFMSGEICIVQYEGSEIPEKYLNQKLSFMVKDENYELIAKGVSYDTLYGGRDIGPSLIVSKEYLRSITSQPVTLNIYIHYNQMYDEVTENKLNALVENSNHKNDLHVESQYESMKEIHDSQGNMMIIGTIIALLLFLVGVLNYINTISGSINSRRLTFSVMESIGMSKKQINRLLIREGILYAAFTVLITLTAGTIITYVCFKSMNYMEIPFRVPVLPMICAIVLISLICIIAPLQSYKRLVGKKSITERLRAYE